MQRNTKPKRMPLKLEKAVKANNIEAVKSILKEKKFEQREWLNAVNGRGRTALLLALKYKSWGVARLLLSHPDTDVNVCDLYGGSVLERAAGYFEMVMLLLNDERLNVPNEQAVYHLLQLYFKHQRELLTILHGLIAKGARVNIDLGDKTTLSRASTRGLAEVVKLLLAQPDVDVNTFNPLAEAMEHHHISVVNLLLADARINVNKGKYNSSPLDMAIRYGHNNAENEACIKALLCHPQLDRKWIAQSGFLTWLQGISQKCFNQVMALASTRITIVENQKRSYNESAYSLRIEINLAEAINVLINDHDFEINELYHDGKTLLNLAISKGYDDIVENLLACQRIDLHRQDQFGYSALTQAEASGKPDLVNKIIQHPGFNLHATYHNRQNLLMHVAEKDCADLAKTLLAMQKFPINDTDYQGNTALILLARNHKNPDDASLFLEFLANGADPLQRNNLGANAIMIAKNNDLKGIADDLKSAAEAPRPQLPDPNTAPSAPPLDEAEYKSIAEAAVQPPPGYYEHGLFGAGNVVSVSPENEIERFASQGKVHNTPNNF